MRRQRLFWPLVFLCSALLTLLCFHRVLSYGFTDKDTLMHITEAKVEGLDDFRELFSKELTGGRAPRDANFYRPTVMLMYAGLRSVFGWNPLGYHAFDLSLHALNGLLLALLAATCARRAGAARSRRFGVLCAAIFLIHPLGVEVVPAIARNGDLLVTAFFLASLLALDRAEQSLAAQGFALGRWTLTRLGVFSALFALTLGSKEPGIVLLGAAFLYPLLFGAAAKARRRIGRSLLLILPCLLITPVYLLVRARVMEEALGGYHLDNPLPYMVAHVARMMAVDLTLPGYAHRIPDLLPQLHLQVSLDPAVLLAAACASLFALALLVRWVSRRSRGGAAPIGGSIRPGVRAFVRLAGEFLRGPNGRLLTFSCAIVGAHAALFVATSVYDRRLLYTAVAFGSFLPSLALLWVVDCWRGSPGSSRRASGLALSLRLASPLVAAGAALLFLRQSPLLHRYDEWRNSGEATYALTEAIRDRWEELPDGSTVVIFNMPSGFSIDPMRRVMFADASSTNSPAPNAVKAWLDDQFPDKQIALSAVAYHRYSEPLEEFRHRARVLRAWLLFRTPKGSTSPDDFLESLTHFQAVEFGGDRIRLAYRRRPVPRHLHVLIFDGFRPLMLPVSKMKGRPRSGARSTR
jgi:hypothetical protein